MSRVSCVLTTAYRFYGKRCIVWLVRKISQGGIENGIYRTAYPKNKPAYYKITASITLNGQTIRKFSRFEFDPKTLKTAKQRAAAATAAAFEFEAKAQEEAERSLSGANKPFQEVAEEYIASAKAKLEPAALLRGNYDSDKNKANTTLNKVGYLKKS